MKKSILISGATGLIGSQLSKFLFDAGYEISVLTRNPVDSLNNLPFVANHINFNSETSLQVTVDNSFAVINLSGASLGGKKWSEDYKQTIISSRVSTTNLLATAISKSKTPPKVFISASAVGYYGDCADNLIDETNGAGSDFLSETCKLWEAESKKANNTRIVNPRIGVVLSKNGGALKKMLMPFRFFVGGALGSGNQWLAWIHIHDLIKLFRFCLENDSINGAINFVSPTPVTFFEFAKVVGRILHRPSFLKVPTFILKLILGESSTMILNSQRVNPTIALRNGFEFNYKTIKVALKDILFSLK